MMIVQVMDGLCSGTRYLVWGMGLLGIFAAILLGIANLSMGIHAIILCLAAGCLAVAVSLLLLPQDFAKGQLAGNKKNIVGGLLGIFAMIMAGGLYFTTGGFPALNLLFV